MERSIVNLAGIEGNKVILHAKDKDYKLSAEQALQVAEYLTTIAEAANGAFGGTELYIPFSEEEYSLLCQHQKIFEQENNVSFLGPDEYVSYVMAEKFKEIAND